MTTPLMNDAERAAFDKLPPVPEGVEFRVPRVKALMDPHPYCVTPKHLQLCDSGILSAETIAHAEDRGAHCGMPGCQLRYAEHRQYLAAIVVLPRKVHKTTDLPGLHEWLLAAKEPAEQAGIEGFAFPTTDQYREE